MNSTNENTEILEFFKTMVDADRLRIAGLLGVETMTPVQLSERLHIPPAKVVTHLERLETAGLVRQQDNGYQLEHKTLEDLARRNMAGRRPQPKIKAFDGDEFDQKVVRDFMGPDGKFKSLPMQQKKFMSVLRYVVNAFEPGETYTEKQVNEMLKRHHPDSASLRRGLVDAGMVARENGIYCRQPEQTAV
jgi:hypothetical protein